MNIYLAGRFDSQAELETRKREIESRTHHKVVSHWLYALKFDQRSTCANNMDWPSYAALRATEDLDDIRHSDMLILDLTTIASATKVLNGGMYVEYGYALALNKRLITIGPLTNVFTHINVGTNFSSWENVIIYLTTLWSRSKT